MPINVFAGAREPRDVRRRIAYNGAGICDDTMQEGAQRGKTLSQDIRMTGLETDKSHDVPSQDGTQRLYLTLQGLPPRRGETFLVESSGLRVTQSGVRQPLTGCVLSLRVPRRT